MDSLVSRGKLLAALVLLAFAAPVLVLGGTVLFGSPVPSPLIIAALVLPLGAITVGLLWIGREVGSKADDPALVDEQLRERIGMTSEEYRELTEE